MLASSAYALLSLEKVDMSQGYVYLLGIYGAFQLSKSGRGFNSAQENWLELVHARICKEK